jgi:predicted ester cyclase
VAYRLTVSGTHKGEFQGIPPTDKKVSFTSTGISNIIDGKVAEDWVDAADWSDTFFCTVIEHYP